MKIKKIWWYLAVVLIIFAILFVILKIGFSISTLQTHVFSANELYIKLDKKLIIKAKNLSIFDLEDSNSSLAVSTQIVDAVQKIEYLYIFFQELDIQNLSFGGQNARFLFKGDEFFLNNDEFSLNLALNRTGKEIKADIKELLFKDYNASADGQILINAAQDSYDFIGILRSQNLNFDFNVTYAKDKLNLDLKDINASNMAFLFRTAGKHLSLNKELNEWFSQKLIADLYSISYLKASMDLGKKFSIKELEGAGEVKNLKVKLGKNVESILIPKLKLNLNKKRLDLNFDQASFAKQDLSQSKIYVYEPASATKSGIYIQIKSNELMLDQKLLNILNLYSIKLPLKQLSGKLNTDFIINIPFAKSEKISFKANFDLENTQLDMANFLVQKGNISLENTILKLNEFVVKNDFLQADVNASFDLDAKKAHFNTEISRLYFKDLLDIKNAQENLELDYSQDILLKAQNFNVDMNLTQGLELSASTLSRFKENSALMQKLGIENVKNFDLKTADFVNFQIKLKGTNFKNDLQKSDGLSYENDDFFISKDAKTTHIKSASENLDISLNEDVIKAKIKNLHYILKDTQKINDVNFSSKLELEALNSGIILQSANNSGKKLSFDELHFDMDKQKMSLKAKRNEAIYELNKDEKQLVGKINKVNDKTLNEFFGSNIVEKGNFELHIKGSGFERFNGEIIMNDTYFKELKFHNQLISFIDTIPSLLLFKSPTFNEKGLSIQKGAVLFEKQKNKITIQALTLDGDSVDILGVGDINLDDKKLDLELELQTLKSATDIISKVPIINQIILGKDRVISTQILVEGDLDNPKFKTQIIKETLKLPFNLLKNIIDIPSTWFE
ncbi:hypothetical protein DMB95_00530 [Campylobacter sp. MIT 12-8780]|uniref:YhdP family protein n=1 Tax=unclassified Campylobacter TaxID=2593542 RepID=UPI00115EB278|nr:MULTISPECIES: AsmA-like C-terminal domain-containing protein [unclassified Campylobacter]NDJ26446.1 DUF3971 domain-containing protein [Campylobacter sp. MIT 19-121]TQR43019.1 hypothetical protein DMB95_00530 [Campylobacter sp. MIT 12-8780]